MLKKKYNHNSGTFSNVERYYLKLFLYLALNNHFSKNALSLPTCSFDLPESFILFPEQKKNKISYC